jgi:hypothetical protein
MLKRNGSTSEGTGDAGGAGMKNAVLLVGMWVGIILFAYSVVFLQSDGFVRVAVPGDAETLDEQIGFALPLPVGWSVTARDGVAEVTSPVAGVEAWVVAVSGATMDSALAAAWDEVDPCSSCERPGVLRSEPPSSGREGAVVSFAPDAEGRTGRAVVLLGVDRARVLLLRFAPGLLLPARVEADLARIEAGFRVVEAEPSQLVPIAEGAA